MTAIATALETFKPTLATTYTKQVTSMFNDLIAKFTPNMVGVANSNQYSQRGSIHHVTKLTRFGARISDRQYEIDDEKLSVAAALYAERTVMESEAKINEKIGEIDNASVKNLNSYSFVITGNRGDKAILIEQQIIVKSSPKGKLFNQFPARIYVDGKFTSEAKYKKLFQ